jgi:hypothetical protein
MHAAGSWNQMNAQDKAYAEQEPIDSAPHQHSYMVSTFNYEILKT